MALTILPNLHHVLRLYPRGYRKNNAYSSVLRADKHRARQAAKRDIKKLILDSSKSFMN